MERDKTSRQGDSAGKQPKRPGRERMASVCGTVVRYLETSKRYLSPGLSIWELALEVGISPRVVSQSINRYMGRNFFELVNRMRTEEAKRLLRETAGNEKVNVAEIGARSGFISRSLFFARFKEYEGMTPRAYMEIHRCGDTEQLKTIIHIKT